jgi:predicted DNA-binding transcriptional regulator AlpA
MSLASHDFGRPPRRLLRLSAVQERIPYSRSTILRLEREGRFPRKVKLSPTAGAKGAIAWYEDEVDAYAEELAAQREAGK